MNIKNGWKFCLLVTLVAAALSGCNSNGSNKGDVNAGEQPPASVEDGSSAADQPGVEEPAQEQPEEQPADEAVEEPSAEEAGSAVDASELPKTKNLEPLVEGKSESVPAELTLSDHGYAFYLMEGFEFTPEEPGVDMVFHKNFPDYYMRIELLPTDANVDDLKKNAEETLKVVGDVVSMEGGEIFDKFVRENSKFFYHAGDNQVSRNITVVEIGGRLFRFTLNFPNGEAAEGVSPRFYPMLDSIVITK